LADVRKRNRDVPPAEVGAAVDAAVRAVRARIDRSVIRQENLLGEPEMARSTSVIIKFSECTVLRLLADQDIGYLQADTVSPAPVRLRIGARRSCGIRRCWLARQRPSGSGCRARRSTSGRAGPESLL